MKGNNPINGIRILNDQGGYNIPQNNQQLNNNINHQRIILYSQRELQNQMPNNTNNINRNEEENLNSGNIIED